MELLKEALSSKPGQTMCCSERDEKRMPSLPLSFFLKVSGLERDKDHLLCLVHQKTRAGRV